MSEETTMTNQQKLVFHLMEKGLSNEEVARALADVAESAFEQFSEEAMKSFTPEDLKVIEAAGSEVLADDEIKRLFVERTGKDAKEHLDEIMEQHAAAYMKEEKDSQLPPQ